MAYYAKKTVKTIVSDSSDYSNALEHEAIDTITPDEYVVKQRVEVATTEQTYYTDHLSSLTDLVVENTDTTNYLLVTVRIEKASKTFSANKLGFNDLGPDTITDDDSTFISSLYFAVGDYAVVTDAAEAGNNSTFTTQAVVAGTLTLINSNSLTNDADDSGTPTIKCRRDITIRVEAGQSLTIPNVVTASNVKLQANTAAVSVLISHLGT